MKLTNVASSSNEELDAIFQLYLEGSIVKSRYVFLFLNQQATVYQYQLENQAWQNLEIKGESILDILSSEDLKQLPSQFNVRLNFQDQLKNIELTILVDDNLNHSLLYFLESLEKLGCNQWQVMRWEPLFYRSNTIQTEQTQHPLSNSAWIADVCLPLLDRLIGFEESSWQEVEVKARHEHEETMESLREEREALELKIQLLQKQLQTKSLPSIEGLLTYLPIIYYNFWTHIKPSDLALLAGTYTIPEIPTPYPEPDTHTIAIMKKRWHNVPEEEQEKIRYFCQELNYPNLKIRPEMRFIVED